MILAFFILEGLAFRIRNLIPCQTYKSIPMKIKKKVIGPNNLLFNIACKIT